MILEYLTVGPFAENSYILGDEKARVGILIDPGHDPQAILDRVRELGLRIEAIVNTHAHIDHVGGVPAIQKALGVPFRLHAADMPLLKALPQQAAMFGLPALSVPEVESHLEEGQTFRVGSLNVRVIETPGHSPGSVTLIVDDDLIVGDVLFAGSVGRTDLYGGDFGVLSRSIRERLFPLGDGCRVWPGHGPETTIGEERRSNPFVGDGAGFSG
jgi:hydroxyacylglutathione hydrolase